MEPEDVLESRHSRQGTQHRGQIGSSASPRSVQKEGRNDARRRSRRLSVRVANLVGMFGVVAASVIKRGRKGTGNETDSQR